MLVNDSTTSTARLLLYAALGLAVLPVGASCSLNGGDEESQSTASAEALRLYDLRFGNPLATSQSAVDAAVSAEQAIYVAISECMEAEGFTLKVPDRLDIASMMYFSGVDEQTRADVEVNGFGVSSKGASFDPLSGMSAPEMESFARCSEVARAQEMAVEQALAAFDESFLAVAEGYLSDERIVEADRQWSDCVRAQGYDASNRSELEAQYSGRTTETPTEDEVKAALAAFDCDEQVRSIREEVLAEYAEQFDEKYKLEALRAIDAALGSDSSQP